MLYDIVLLKQCACVPVATAKMSLQFLMIYSVSKMHFRIISYHFLMSYILAYKPRIFLGSTCMWISSANQTFKLSKSLVGVSDAKQCREGG